jgi:sulfite exporter TauE/SafE
MIAEDRPLGRSIRIIVELCTGRLAAYLLLGALVGILAVRAESPLLMMAAGIAMIASAIIILYFAFSGRSSHPGLCRLLPDWGRNIPILFGFLTSFNLCSPLLGALGKAVQTGSVEGSILTFLGFFTGTSAFLALLVPLSLAGRSEDVRLIGRIIAVFAGILLLVSGALALLQA